MNSDYIFKNLKEIVSPLHTALVLWDVQKGLKKSVFNEDQFMKNLTSLVKSARSFKVPIIYTKLTPVRKDYESPWRLYWQMKRFGVDDPDKLPSWMAPGTPEAEICDEVMPEKQDMILAKHSYSIFIGTYFENMMRNSGISTLLFTGLTTEVGVDSSARDSSSRGFYTIVVSDCVSSSSEEMHTSSLKTLKKVCLVHSSTDIIKEWE